MAGSRPRFISKPYIGNYGGSLYTVDPSEMAHERTGYFKPSMQDENLQ